MIRIVEKADIKLLAKIYKDLYDNVDIGENWSIDSAIALLNYWYEKQKDLFFVAIEDGKPVGACVSGVKNWFDGIRLVDTEIFVDKTYQGKGIAKELMLNHLLRAKLNYNAKTIEFHTYGDETEFPQNWYSRIGFKKDEELIIMNGDVETILGKLGFNIKNNKYIDNVSKMAKEQFVKTISYGELINIYNSLDEGDEAYIFDMLPEYAYLGNDEEKEYLSIREEKVSNFKKVHLIIVGSETKLNKISNNSLFQEDLKKIPKAIILHEEDLKQTCPYHYYQLGNGLYYGQMKDGCIEVFRDLWSDESNLGIYYKNMPETKLFKQTIDTIMNKISNGDLINHYNDYVKLL